METSEYTIAAITVRDYVCARCWSFLIVRADRDFFYVRCENPNCDGQGFVTKHYAELRRSESLADKLDAQKALKEIFPSEHKDKTSEELIIELGFRR